MVDFVNFTQNLNLYWNPRFRMKSTKFWNEKFLDGYSFWLFDRNEIFRQFRPKQNEVCNYGKNTQARTIGMGCSQTAKSIPKSHPEHVPKASKCNTTTNE